MDKKVSAVIANISKRFKPVEIDRFKKLLLRTHIR
nr:MAG TPA: hypothetical protein [Caudoviricetes sp.]